MEPFLEFGFAGIDSSVKTDVLREALEVPPDLAASVRFVVAIQLAYQGTLKNPTAEYSPGSDPASRRYGGLTYPSWEEIAAFRDALPKGTPFSFHLNETPYCRYVSGLLSGDEEIGQLVTALVQAYNARHIQINLTADGVPPEIFAPPDAAEGKEDKAGMAVKVIHELCDAHPSVLVVVPIAQMTRRDGNCIDTLPFFRRLLEGGPRANLCAFFDASAGTGKEPTAVAQLPEEYPRGEKVRAGFTGGIRPDNAKEWLHRYAGEAERHGCLLLCDAQSGFRENHKRDQPVNPEALQELSREVCKWGREWLQRQPSGTKK